MPLKKVKKADLVDSIYEATGYDKGSVQEIVDEFIVQLKTAMEQGSTIELRGLGTFEVRLRKGRKVARNPKTGANVSVEPHYVAAFRAGQSLKENLWKLEITDEK